MLSHPKDASQWKALNFEYPEFGKDPRNIVLGASTDGVNPLGSQRSTHSTWPVFVWMYKEDPVTKELTTDPKTKELELVLVRNTPPRN